MKSHSYGKSAQKISIKKSEFKEILGKVKIMSLKNRKKALESSKWTL
jgi:hypothetical protein